MADSKDIYRTVTPYLLVPDADHELAFVKAAFGGTEVNCQRNADNGGDARRDHDWQFPGDARSGRRTPEAAYGGTVSVGG
jgi:hypothetical protein